MLSTREESFAWGRGGYEQRGNWELHRFWVEAGQLAYWLAPAHTALSTSSSWKCSPDRASSQLSRLSSQLPLLSIPSRSSSFSVLLECFGSTFKKKKKNSISHSFAIALCLSPQKAERCQGRTLHPYVRSLLLHLPNSTWPVMSVAHVCWINSLTCGLAILSLSLWGSGQPQPPLQRTRRPMARQQLIWAGTGRGPVHRRVIPIKPCCGPVPSSTWPSAGQVRTSWWASYSSGKSGTVCWGQRESVAEPGSDTPPHGTEGLLWGFSNSGLSLSGVSLDVILESETKTLTVLLGEPATFHCNITGGNWKNYQMSWYKRNENNILT